MASEWYIARSDQQFGPFSSRQLKELVATDHLRPTDMVCKAGMNDWVVASRIKGLFPNPASGEIGVRTDAETVVCPHCARHFAGVASFFGKMFSCPHCANSMLMPDGAIGGQVETVVDLDRTGGLLDFPLERNIFKADPDVLPENV